jgi:hypothetical protein
MGALKSKYSETLDFSRVNSIIKGLLSSWWNTLRNILMKLN